MEVAICMERWQLIGLCILMIGVGLNLGYQFFTDHQSPNKIEEKPIVQVGTVAVFLWLAYLLFFT